MLALGVLSRILVLLCAMVSAALAVEQPGPSAALLANPTYSGGIGLIYTCVANYYVSVTGSDSNPGTQAQPWATIQHAESVPRSPGDCINVAPGTYNWSTFFYPAHGGNSASPTGYVTYRCEVLDQCFVVYTGMAGEGTWVLQVATPYLIIDGFDIDGGEQAAFGGLAAECVISTLASGPVGHHVWILNNKVHGCGLGCVGVADSEYYFILHNDISDCAWWSVFQGSGACFCSLKALGDDLNPFPPYTPTQYDLAFAPFHNIASWNRIWNNGCQTCLTILTTHTSAADTNGTTTISNIANLGTQASFTGSFPANSSILTVTGSTGTISPGDLVTGTNTFQSTFIEPYGSGGTTGTGGDGTYQVTVSSANSPIGPEAMTSSTLGNSVLVEGPGIQPFTYILSMSGNSATVSRPALTTQSGGTFQFIVPFNGHTDGNGFINDTWCGFACGGTGNNPYDYADKQTLISFNEVQFNGGRGIEAFATYYVTVANNSTYHNGMDMYLGGLIGELAQSGGINNSWYNNNAVSVSNGVTNCNYSGVGCNYCIGAGNGRGIVDTNIIWQHNVVFGAGAGGTCVDVFDNDRTMYWVPADNRGDVDPQYVNETSNTIGDLHLQLPTSPAINYQYPSSFAFLPKETRDTGAYQSIGVRTNTFVGVSQEFSGGVDFLFYTEPLPPLSCSEATAFLARANAVSGIDRVHTGAYSDLICGMVLDGTWCGASFDAIYVQATQTAGIAELNLCSTNYTLIASGSPTFTRDKGFNGADQSSTVYLDTQFNPNTAVSPNYTLNGAGVSVWSLTNTLTDTNPAYALGMSPQAGLLSGITALMPSEPSGNGAINPFVNVNSANFSFAGPPRPLTASNGYFFGTMNSGTVTAYLNGTSIFSYAETPLAIVCNIFILANDNCAIGGIPSAANGASVVVSFSTIGTALSQPQIASVCHRFNIYLTEVGTLPAGTC